MKKIALILALVVSGLAIHHFSVGAGNDTAAAAVPGPAEQANNGNANNGNGDPNNGNNGNSQNNGNNGNGGGNRPDGTGHKE